MSFPGCPRVDDAASYVLRAMADGEWEHYRYHLGECATCADKVAELSYVSDALLSAVPQLTAPAPIRDRVMTVVRSESELLRAAGPAADLPPARPRRGQRMAWMRPWPATVLATSLLALGIGGGALLVGGADAPQQTITATCEFAGCKAQMDVDSDSARLVVAGLPAPPDGRIYQVWLARKGVAAPEPTDGLFSVNHDGHASVAVPGDLRDVESVLVTDEPLGGSRAPTRTPVIAARMA